tara:strand:+ start:740 stop:946 length:207 start_codon:yes stop_codon:yes gene_type:complete
MDEGEQDMISRLRRKIALWIDPSLTRDMLFRNMDSIHWRLSLCHSILPHDAKAAREIARRALGKPVDQ